MSQPPQGEEQKQGGFPWRNLLHPGKTEDKSGRAEAMIKSDKNNETKTRTPGTTAAFAFSVLDLYAKRAKGEITTLDQLLDYHFDSGGFGDRHRINLIPVDGKSREEFVRISMAELFGQLYNMEDFGSKTQVMTEGQKKK
jgi:hypothetical protein